MPGVSGVVRAVLVEHKHSVARVLRALCSHDPSESDREGASG